MQYYTSKNQSYFKEMQPCRQGTLVNLVLLSTINQTGDTAEVYLDLGGTASSNIIVADMLFHHVCNNGGPAFSCNTMHIFIV